MFTKQILGQLFTLADSDTFDVKYWDGTLTRYGSGDPRFTLRIHDEKILDYLGEDLEVGLGEAYMAGAFDVEGDLGDLVALATRTFQAHCESSPQGLMQLAGRVVCELGKRSPRKQRHDIEHHYDLGNDFFELWLDSSRCYSCAYFANPDDTLETAQQRKIDYSLRKLRLRSGETLLDIGSGWGALVIRAAGCYGARAVGITLSKEQQAYSCAQIGLQSLHDMADVRLEDYNSLANRGVVFDKIVSIGMIEHVGKAHLADFAGCVGRMLKPGGLALLHFISNPHLGSVSPWLDRYIFPGAYLPTVAEMLDHLTPNNLRILDVENLRPHYEMTLDNWSERFERHVPEIRDMFGEKFVRMWRLYLRGCSASFRIGTVAIHQILVSNGVPDSLPLTREDLYR